MGTYYMTEVQTIIVGLCTYMRYVYTYTQGQNEEYLLRIQEYVRTYVLNQVHREKVPLYIKCTYVCTYVYIRIYVHTYVRKTHKHACNTYEWFISSMHAIHICTLTYIYRTHMTAEPL